MKNLLLIILTFLTISKTYSQEGYYEYSDLGCYESFEIKPDSFVYQLRCGLMFNIVTGTVQNVNDTLILNSDIQPSFSLQETFDSSLKNDTIVVVFKHVDFLFFYGLRVVKNEQYYDLDLQDRSVIRMEHDSIENSISFYLSTNLFSRREKLFFMLYRTNLKIELNWQLKDINRFEIDVNALPGIVDYHFFTNKRAVIEKRNLIILDDEGKPEKTNYSVKTRKRIKMSKKKKVKKYRYRT
ncbi:MAG: hypothetical protein DWQ02_02855 [Bacteroidetes bacterium]|nr:MAG: hypothetical protein DWQ02_02855 [Bacteroidota bacterium]